MLDYNEIFGTKKKDDKKETKTFSDTFGIGGTKENNGVNTGGDAGKDNKPSDSVFSYNPPKTVEGSSPTNPKVNTNEKWSTDVNYFDPNMDYSLIMNQLMGQGADASVIRQLQTLRRNKALSDPSLYQYYQDGTDIAADNYIKVRSFYENKRQRDIDALMQRLNGRKDFEYDPEKDELYQSLKSQALKKGQRAMEDTLSRATQNAGGNNSYAISAAQGAYNDYLSGVDDLIPQLEQLAYGKYQDKINQDYNMLNLQMALENQDYSRWNDTQNRNLQESQIQKEDFWTAMQWARQEAQDIYNKAKDDDTFNMQLALYGITPSGDRQKDIQALAEAVALEKLASKKGSTVKGGEDVDDLDENELFEELLIDKGKEGDSQAEEERIAKILNPFLKYEELVEKEANKDNGKIDVPYVGKISTEEALALIKSGKAEYVINEDGSIEFRLKDKGLLGAGDAVTGFMTKNFLDKITG